MSDLYSPWRNRKGRRKSEWPDEEQQRLFKLAKTSPMLDEVYAAFPNRSKKAIHDRLYRMGFSRDRGRVTVLRDL